MQGIWIDRTAMSHARQRGDKVTEADFTDAVEMRLDPLPCWRHLNEDIYRARILEVVEDIEGETRERHRREQTAPRGAAWVRRRHPHERPHPGPRSPRPRFHAYAREIRTRLVAAYREFLKAYRVAAECLHRGEINATFPENCYPPRLPFVEPLRLEPG